MDIAFSVTHRLDASAARTPLPMSLCPASVAARGHLRGFTLVEVIVAIALIGLLARTATYFWVDGLGLARSIEADSASMADGRAAMERLAREIREVKYNANGLAYCVSTMTATKMVFNKTPAGTSPNPVCGIGDFTVTIQTWPTNNVYLAYSAAPAASQALTANASTFTLAYLQADAATAATTADKLHYVRVTMTQTPSTLTGAPTMPATILRTLVALRNN